MFTIHFDIQKELNGKICSITLSCLSLIMICVLLLSECITHSSSVGLEEIILIAIVN